MLLPTKSKLNSDKKRRILPEASELLTDLGTILSLILEMGSCKIHHQPITKSKGSSVMMSKTRMSIMVLIRYFLLESLENP